MLLFTIVYEGSREDIIMGTNEMKEYFATKKIHIGCSELMENNTHFVKIFCDDNNYSDRVFENLKLFMANIILNVVIDTFFKKEVNTFLSDTYFFLKYDEISEIKEKSLNILKNNKKIVDESSIYYLNRKNEIIKKIEGCIDENREFNLDGFVRFRMNDFKEDIEEIIDKVVEEYMAQKEYDEFIKLLKYFVEIQESKINVVNIIVDKSGDYLIKDENGYDIKDELFKDIDDSKYSDSTSFEDMLISGLITNVPQKVIIHCQENCKNHEFIETLKNVFEDRISFCNDCSICNKIKEGVKNN